MGKIGQLLIVSTPIGNLEDITLRALKILGEADIILAEDTRTATKLLKHHKINYKQLLSFFEGNEEKRINQVIDELKAGKNIALISESGTPLISDPGFKLARKVIKQTIFVSAIPGPSALIAALSVSGLPINSFVFLGFLPKKLNKIKGIFSDLKSLENIKTFVFYESPYRLIKTLKILKDDFGEVDVAVARELTKLHEEVLRGTPSQLIDHFEKNSPRGEIAVIVSF